MSRDRKSQRDYLDAIFDIAQTENKDVIVENMRSYKYVHKVYGRKVYITIHFRLFLI